MILYIGQDYAGNIHITDERDVLPSDLTSFDELHLPYKGHFQHTEDPTLHLEVQDVSEIFSIVRKGI